MTDEQRSRLRQRLASRLDSSGRLRLVSSGSRSQLANRREAAERFRELLEAALVIPKQRRKTRPSRAARERRLEEKKRKSARKAERRRPPDD